jgi:uncharacterized membrane protein
MKPRILLLLSITIVTVILRLVLNHADLTVTANLAVCLMLFLTAPVYFLFTDELVKMLPRALPFKFPIIYLIGVADIISALALSFFSLKSNGAGLLGAFFCSSSNYACGCKAY